MQVLWCHAAVRLRQQNTKPFSYWLQQNLTQSTATSRRLWKTNISDDEYKLVLEEIEKYRTMKEAIRREHLSAAGSMIDEETKNALIQRRRDEARATFIKKLAVSDSL